MDSHQVDLTCPISLELLEDPISTPCCGQALSRASLRAHLATERCCPLCRADLQAEYSSFDVETVAKNRTLASLVDAHRERIASGEETNVPAADVHRSMAARLAAAQDAGPQYRCSLVPCCTKGGTRLPVGRMSVDVEWPSYEGDVCLVMPVIDKSGSMGGQPFAQVKTALLHMLHQTLANRSVFTCIIPYDSRAEVIKVPRDGGAETERWLQTQAHIQNMQAGGGTSFYNAFAKVKEVLFGDTSGGKVRAQDFEPGTAEFEAQRQLGRKGLLVQGAPAFVKSVVIVFMTDGQDNTRSDRKQLAEYFRDMLSEWTKEIVVHTVGFSSNHDFQFLNSLRKMGRTEGSFRYAEPSDGADALCSKLSELTDAIVASTCLPVRVDRCPFPRWDREGDSNEEVFEANVIMRDGRGSAKFFVKLGADEAREEKETRKLELSVSPGKVSRDRLVSEVPIQLSAGSAGVDEQVLAEWQGHLVDEVVQELSSLAANSISASTRSLAMNLHLGFLLQRAKALEVHVTGSMHERLTLCLTQINAMLSGSAVSIARLADARLTKLAAEEKPCDAPGRASAPAFSPPARTSHCLVPSSSCPSHGSMFFGRKGLTSLHKAVLQGTVDSICRCVEEENDDFACDEMGDTALAIAAAIGRCNAAEALLSSAECTRLCLSRANANGETPLKLAALRGHWNMLELLVRAGAGVAVSQRDAEILIEQTLRRSFSKSAGALVAAGLGSVTVDMLRGRVSPETLQWVMLKFTERDCLQSENNLDPERGRLYLHQAVENSMLELVNKLLGQGVRPTSEDIGKLILLCVKAQDQFTGAEIADALLSATDEGLHSLGEQIFAAAGAGSTQLLEVLVRQKGCDYDWQDRQGSTGMLVACQARHLGCLVALLSANASPSIANHAGESPLMASCRRNHCAAVAALLGAGALVLGAASGDVSAVALCCQIGRPEILDMLLKHATRLEGHAKMHEELRILCSLQLAAQHDQPSCIKQLLDHSADVEFYTPDSHRSLPRATALHFAAFHGCCGSASALLESGALVDAQDSLGRTALHMAVQQRHVLMVRLLRSAGSDMHAVDSSGNVPSSYCLNAEGDAAAALRAELLDPALEFLLAAARQYDEHSCGVLRFAGLPGYQPVSSCLDVHSGDHWTPLLEAVACGNLKFAGSLVKKGSDPHRANSQGLSPLFWAHVLHGREAAVALAAKHLPVTPSYVDVRCNDGVLHVSKAASDWMDINFPAVAAAAVPCATLALTLKAQGLLATSAAEEVPAELPGMFTQSETKALDRLQSVRQRNVRDAMVLEMHFEKEHLGCGFGRIVDPERHIKSLIAMMRHLPEPALLTTGSTGRGVAEVLAKACSTSALDTLQSLARDPEVCFEGQTAMMSHLARARHAAITAIASESKEDLQGLSLLQLFVLHALREDSRLLDCINRALSTGKNRERLTPLAAGVLEALCSLPSADSDSVFYCLLHKPNNSATYVEGIQLTWPAFVVGTEDASALKGNAASMDVSSQQILLTIKASSCRRLPGFFGDLRVSMLLPGTTLCIVATSHSSEGHIVQMDLEEV